MFLFADFYKVIKLIYVAVGGYFFILLQTESFSPDTKATGVGYTQGFGQIGSFLAP